MRIPRIYLPASLTVGATVALDDSTFGHVVRVLRLKPGATLELFDGAGHAVLAILTDVGKRDAWAQITEVLPAQAEPPLNIILAQGISRAEKMDFTLQKAVELGANIVQPLFTERSGVELREERLARKIQHWQGIIIGACEQCGGNRLPTLYEPLSLIEWLTQSRPPSLSLVLNPTATQSLRDLSPPTRAVTLLVGPEGGLSPAEIAQAVAAAFISIRLGPRILRTETAGLAVLAAIQTLWGDW